MKKLVVSLFTVLFCSVSSSAFAEDKSTIVVENSAVPKVTISVAEGYTILFKDGVTPGSATTRFGLGLSWRLPKNFLISATVGVSISNTEAKPAPRVIVGLGYVIDDRWSFGGGLLYQVNPGYGKMNLTNLFSLSVGPTVKLGGGFSFSFQLGPAKCIEGGSWSLFFQPGFSYTF